MASFLQFDIWNAFAQATPELKLAVATVQSGPKCNPSCKLLVSNLDFGDTNSDINGKYGKLQHAAVQRDRHKRSLGTVEVVFEHRSDAVLAMKRFQGVPLDGRPMKMMESSLDTVHPLPKCDPPCKLSVSNLEFGVTNSDIIELFSEFGKLQRAAIHRDRSERSLGTADVIFEHRSDALKALKKYQGIWLDGRPMRIEASHPEVVYRSGERGSRGGAGIGTPLAGASGGGSSRKRRRGPKDL